MHENVVLEQKVREKQQNKKVASELSYEGTEKSIDKAVTLYNKGSTRSKSLKQVHFDTLKQLYVIYIKLYNSGSEDILKHKKVIQKGYRNYLCPRFLTNGAALRKMLGQASAKTFDNHMKRLKEAGFLEREIVLSDNKIRKARTNSSCITLLRPDLLKYRKRTQKA